MKKLKTYKREMSFVLFVFLMSCAVWAILGNPMAYNITKLFILPVFSFGAGAFGLDAVLKHVGGKDGNPSE